MEQELAEDKVVVVTMNRIRILTLLLNSYKVWNKLLKFSISQFSLNMRSGYSTTYFAGLL